MDQPIGDGSGGHLPPTYDEAARDQPLGAPRYEALEDAKTSLTENKGGRSVGNLANSIAAAPSYDHLIKLFAVGLDGVIREGHVMSSWSSDCIRPTPGGLDGLQVPRSAPLSAVSHLGGQVYLFVVDGEGTAWGNRSCPVVQDEGEDQGSGKGKRKKREGRKMNHPRSVWMGWHRLGEAAALPRDAHLVAVSPAVGRIDLFASNDQGDIVTLTYGPNPGATAAIDNSGPGLSSWTHHWRLLCPRKGCPGVQAVPGCPICAVAPWENRIDLYLVDVAGVVQACTLGPDAERAPPIWLSPPGNISAIPGSHIAAVVKRPVLGRPPVLYAFLVDANGTVQCAASHLSPSGVTTHPWSATLSLYPPKAKASACHSFPQGSQLAAFAQESGYISVMGITTKGFIVQGETRTSGDRLYGWEVINVDKSSKSEKGISFAGGPLVVAVSGPENVVAVAVGREGSMINAMFADWCDCVRWMGWWKVPAAEGVLRALSLEEARDVAGDPGEEKGGEGGYGESKETGDGAKSLLGRLKRRWGI